MAVIKTSGSDIHITGLPNECPFCHKTITPIPVYAYRKRGELEALLACPNDDCLKSFLAYYTVSTGSHPLFNGSVMKGNIVGKKFSENIEKVSPTFTEIYNQAYEAEQLSLFQICGVGYRKALEFLIKDYVILNNLKSKEKIEKIQLAQCIKEYVNDERLKSVAKRAAWLGNDETHYVRKWDTHNLEDLKKLIDLTVHWVEMELLTKTFEKEMPE